MRAEKVLPSGAEILIDRANKTIAIDRILCDPKHPWPDDVCDAMNRLLHTAAVRRKPSRRGHFFAPVKPMTTYLHTMIPRSSKGDAKKLIEAFVTADAGDAVPADRLAHQWFDEWPETCPWRLDVAYELWKISATPISVRDAWRLLRDLPYAVPRLTQAELHREVSACIRRGELEWATDLMSASSTWRLFGSESPWSMTHCCCVIRWLRDELRRKS